MFRIFLSRFSRSSALRRVPSKDALGFSTWSNPVDDVSAKKIFAKFSIYKGKAALSVQPILPQFNLTESGNSVIKKQGSVMLTFMPSAGHLKYDYTKKQIIALTPTELGRLISLADGESCEFFHDPSIKSSNAGQIRKALSVSPAGSDGSYFFSLGVSNVPLNTQERFSVPVSKAEFSVLKTSFSFILPHIMGWGRLVTEAPNLLQPVGTPEKTPPHRFSRETEWTR